MILTFKVKVVNLEVKGGGSGLWDLINRFKSLIENYYEKWRLKITVEHKADYLRFRNHYIVRKSFNV
jgi:hypothetical protein